MSGRSIKAYRALLRVHPKPFRQTYGAEMVRLFGDQTRDARHRGRAAVARYWAAAFVDVAKTAPSEHWDEGGLMRVPPSRSIYVAAAVIGYPMFILSFSSHTFWDAVTALGLAGSDWTHPVIAGVGLVLTGVAWTGWYRRIDGRRWVARVAIGAVWAGIALALVSLVGFFRPPWEDWFLLTGIGGALMWAGVLAMQAAAIRQARTALDFVPFALVASLVGVMVAYSAEDRFALDGPVTRVVVAIHVALWMALAAGLWARPGMSSARTAAA
ncbi:MAG: hypothetical protein ACLGHX_02475 [Acidimicrobiia bacterium]